ncbi:MAG: AAA family ATPase [Chromatiaceae bacterium]|nr:AAA family ATPase [Chromatiaceae bacterium]
MVASLMDPRRWPQGGGERRRIDTHISTVILAGDLAYKLKKPLDLGFLDFLSLDARRQACLAEVRLNRRLAPEIYLGVSAISGSIQAPRVDGDGPAIDWAVRMQRFDPDAILANLAAQIRPPLIVQLADRVARFHAEAATCPQQELFGTPPVVFAPMQQNFEQIHALFGSADASLESLRVWTLEEYARLGDALRARKSDGHVRECHGDLHLGNVALIDARPVVFDAIEFNPGFRWIDTLNDVAFLTMDLHHRARPELAYQFLDRYLQIGGDYAGLAVLRFYEVYRAMVRAKIAAIRLHQQIDASERGSVEAEFAAYIALAGRLTRGHSGALLITHGLSGSGKSHVTAGLPGELPAVRLRSDVERKRLLGIDPGSDASAVDGYSRELTERTYARLAQLARGVVEAGYVAVIDATFLKRAQRARFSELAAALQVPFVIIDCDAAPPILRERILRRRSESGNVSDADLSVLEMQLRNHEPLDAAEVATSIPVGPDLPLALDRVRQLLDAQR